MEKITDHQLVRQYLKGDEKSLEILVARYINQIYRFAFKYLNYKEMAEDITQETFVKVWRNIKKIDKNKNFKSWIYTIAKNTALDLIKKKKSIPFSNFETELGKNIIIDTLTDKSLMPDKISEQSELKDIFLYSIKKLSDKYKLVLSLYYYKHLNFREIAEELQESINTIKSRHRRGLILLKKELGNDLAF